MSQRILQVDAFADRPFAGNPAAVCVMDRPADAGWMQNVAMEMNLAETAFLWPEGDIYRLRWFTPALEVDLCGHATLASAHALWEEGHLPPDREARFETRSGRLTARKTGEGIELNFPADPPDPVDAPSELVQAVGRGPLRAAKGRLGYVFEFASESEVRDLKPDFKAMSTASRFPVAATAPGDASDLDFVSRFFAPTMGIDEDPVTGAAHCCLGPYWRDRLGRESLRAFQASARGGRVGVRIEGDRVALTGRAVTVLRGELV